MRGTSGKDIQSVLDYIYCGEVTLEQDNVSSFLDLAKSLKIQHLSLGTHTDQLNDVPKSDKVVSEKAHEEMTVLR